MDCYRHCALSDEGNFSCTQSSAGLKSKAFIESIPTDSRSHQSSESSLLDSHSHGYCLDSQNRFVFSQKGVYPLPAPLSPEKAAAVFAALRLQAFGTAIKGRASLFPCLVKNAKNALLHFFNAFLPPRQGREMVGAIAPTHCNEAKPSAECKTDSESKEGLESHFDTSDSNNNVRNSASRAQL